MFHPQTFFNARRLLDDLHELRAFLLQRETEAAAGASAALAAALPEQLQQWAAPGATGLALAELRGALEELSGPRTSQLLSLLTSERSTSRLVRALQQQAAKETKFRRCAHGAS